MMGIERFDQNVKSSAAERLAMYFEVLQQKPRAGDAGNRRLLGLNLRSAKGEVVVHEIRRSRPIICHL